MIRSLLSKFRSVVAGHQEDNNRLSLYLVNDPDSGVSDSDFARLVIGAAVYLQQYVAKEWGDTPPMVSVWPATETERPTGSGVAVIKIVPDLPDDPGVGGFHAALGTQGLYDGFISAAGLDFDALCETVTHELNETIGDPMCNVVVTAPNGSKWPRERCDAPQAKDNGQRIPVDIADKLPPIQCANFVTKNYFVGGSDGPWDHLGQLSGPFSIGPYGYSAVTSPDGTTTDIFGPTGGLADLPPEKLHWSSRVQVRKQAMRDDEEQSRRDAQPPEPAPRGLAAIVRAGDKTVKSKTEGNR